MDEKLPLCECGCGQETAIYRGKSRRFIRGHNRRGVKVYDLGMEGITQDLLKELFDYRDGELYWKESGAGRKTGVLAGTVQKSWYRTIGINGKRYFAHRLIFLYHHDHLPKYLDHIDGNPSNNHITNLRESTLQENQMNRRKNKSMNGKPTSSKFKGVSWDKANKKWMAAIRIAGKLKNIGRFTSEIKASKAYNAAAIKYFGEFARLNIIPQH